jgi:hypothetical protein
MIVHIVKCTWQRASAALFAMQLKPEESLGDGPGGLGGCDSALRQSGFGGLPSVVEQS